MMTIHVELSGPIRLPDGRRSLELQLPDRALAADVLRALGLAERQFGFLSLTVDGARVRPEAALASGSRLVVHLPAGGG